MTAFSNLLAELQSFGPAHPLVFETDEGEIGAGYHVTELRHSTSKGIDCGGNIETWQEGRLQLLDGNGDTHMSVGKFSTIVANSLSLMPELAKTSFLIEFAPRNVGLKLMNVGQPTEQDGRVVLHLSESRAVCKPAQRSRIGADTAGACCGGYSDNSLQAACCSPGENKVEVTACCQ